MVERTEDLRPLEQITDTAKRHLEKIKDSSTRFMKRFIPALFVAESMVPFLATGNAQAEEPKESKATDVVSVDFNLGGGYERSPISKVNIGDGVAELYPRGSIGGSLGLQLSAHPSLNIKLGLDLKHVFDLPPTMGQYKYGNKKNTIKSGTGTPTFIRVYNAYLTDKNTLLRPSIYFNIEGKSDGFGIGAGIELYEALLMGEYGIGEGNNVSTTGRERFGKFRVARPYATFRFYDKKYRQYFGFTGGLSYIAHQVVEEATQAGKPIQVQFDKNAWFLKFEAGTKF